MSNFFTDSGHITKQAFKQFLNGKLNDLACLEIAEHLSFCDECIECLVDETNSTLLFTPPHEMKKNIIKTLYVRTAKALLNKYTAYVAAAVIALVLWGSGLSGDIAKMPQQLSDYAFGIRTQREIDNEFTQSTQTQEGRFQLINSTIDELKKAAHGLLK